jgi:hypothetical protein
MAEMWNPLHPKYNIVGMRKPFGFSNTMTIPKPEIAAISSWLHS